MERLRSYYMQHVFFKIGDMLIAVGPILLVRQHENGNIDIDYGRNDETLLLSGDEASQFMALLHQHCQVMTKDVVMH